MRLKSVVDSVLVKSLQQLLHRQYFIFREGPHGNVMLYEVIKSALMIIKETIALYSLNTVSKVL